MPTLVDVIRRHGPSYLARFGKAVLPSQARALRDIVRCRTPEMGRTSRCVRIAARNTRKIIRAAIVRALNVALSAPRHG